MLQRSLRACSMRSMRSRLQRVRSRMRPAKRRGARAMLDVELARLVESTGAGGWADAVGKAEPDAEKVAPPATKSAPPQGIVLATPELLDMLTVGAPLNLRAAEKLVAGLPG